MDDVAPADRAREVAEICLRACDMPAELAGCFVAACCQSRDAVRADLDLLLSKARAGRPAASPQTLPTPDLEQLAGRLHAFARTRAPGGPADLAGHVVVSDDGLRERLLVELIKLDQKCRWSLRQPKPLESYLEEWPELRARPLLLGELLWSECVSRAVFAASATRAELELRFPAIAAQVDLEQADATAVLLAGVLRASPRGPGLAFTDRFTVVRKIGEGGMGVVYEATDLQRATQVALKTLSRFDAMGLYRFKREFRALCGLAHPNLVPLYELISDGQQWFFTMELIHGVNFIAHVRGAHSEAATGQSELPELLAPTGQLPAPDEARLRAALRQLVEGVIALHDAHILHRDLKPSNVLVRDDGRVVILDVGVAKALGGPESGQDLATAPDGHPPRVESWTRDEEIVGSVPYMSPEQASAGLLTEASDWYAVGVMLYEALTGSLPFTGTSLDVLMRKRTEEVEPPGVRVTGLPADLHDLCVALLRRDPAERPDGRQLLARLAPSRAGSPVSPATRASTFVGRESSLAVLASAYRTLEEGRPATVHVCGRSGAGKTALVHRFLSQLPEFALVLSGRCYEQESVPYKALDSIVDDIGRWLMGRPHSEVVALIPPDIAALARVFPVLQRVDAVSVAVSGRPEIPDVRELRRRAFGALGEMLRRMGSTAPLVMAIDDLQWGDVDSAALLISLLEAPDPPRLLLIASYRTESAEQNPCLVALTAARSRHARFEVEVNPLSFDEARQLAALLLDQAGEHAQEVDRIARDSGGNPYFVYELAKQTELAWAGSRGLPGAAQLGLDEVLWQRVRRLDPTAQHLLEVLAVAGTPLSLRSASDAASLGHQSSSAAAILHAERLIRGTGPGIDDAVETYHDRIRESVVHHLSDAARIEHHRRLALALEAASHPDPEATAAHFHHAGLVDKARHHYALAADKALVALAFDRAAELYGRALEPDGNVGGEARQRLEHKRGDALANAGRGYEAGKAYQRAAAGAAERVVVELQRKAGYQYFVSGHIDEGRQAFETVLARFGMHLPRTRRRALVSLLWRRLRLRLRGMAFQERREADVPAQELERVDIFWSVAAGMTIADPIRGAEFQTYDLMLALRAGEPYRVARALAWEAAHISMTGIRQKARAEQQLATAEMLAARLNRPHASGMVRMARGVAAYFEGDFVQCRESCTAAAQIFRDECTGVSWELETCNAFALWSLYFRGAYAELSHQYPTLLAEVRQRGARLAEADLTTFGGPFVWLASDDPDGAARAVASAMGEWSHQDFQVQHFTTLTAEAQIDLYRGDGRAAWERVRSHWAGLADAMLLHVEIVRVYMLHLRARTALAALDSGVDRETLLGSATRDADRLSRERPPYAKALARTVRAAVAAERGDRDTALGLMGSAADELDRLSWGCFGTGARRQYGLLLGGDSGRRIVQGVDDGLLAQGVKRPDRLAAVQVPGGGRTLR